MASASGPLGLPIAAAKELGYPDEGAGGERIMALNRLILGLLAFPFTASVTWASPLNFEITLGVGTAYVILSLALLLDVMVQDNARAWRRVFAMVLDAACVSVALGVGGDKTSLIYPAYLWMIFGNGFRFGLRSVVTASALSIAGFSTVVVVTPFWRVHPSLSAGLVGALIVLPAYASMLIARLQKARRQAEAANRAKTLFLAGVSHELRTPLHAIVGTGELLGATPLDAEQAGMISTISVAATMQLGLIDDLLRISSIEAGKVDVVPAGFDLTRLLIEVQGMVSAQARAKGLMLNAFITARTPLRLRGDARHLRQILLNLCGNAVKFTDQGSVTIAVDGVARGASAVVLRFEVSDTGIGIAPEARKRVFEVFTQADETVLNRYGGTGLGLSIVDRLVRRLGGQVGIEGNIGHGSTFWVSVEVERDAEITPDASPAHVVVVSSNRVKAAALAARVARLGAEVETAPGLEAFTGDGPCIALLMESGAVMPGPYPIVAVRQDSLAGLPGREVRERFASLIEDHATEQELRNALQIAAAHLPAHDTSLALPGRASVPLRILVADDNRVNQTVTTRILEHAGHAVTVVGNGEDALEVLTSGETDVALMDVNMPVLSGIEAAQSYQFAKLDGPRIPLIGLTADASAETTRRCLDAGMTACLLKPVKSQELLRVIQDVAAHHPPDGPAISSKPVVMAIAAHPRFRAAQPAPVDRQAIADLAALGGDRFVAQVVREFIADAEAIVADLEAAAALKNVHDFRAAAHALCSSAANVGATALRAVCDPWQHIALSDLTATGPELMERLRYEWRRTRAGLYQAAGLKEPMPMSSQH